MRCAPPVDPSVSRVHAHMDQDVPEVKAEGVAVHVLGGMSQDVMLHIFEKNVQLQADEVDKVRASRRLYGLMSMSQVARFIGASSVREIQGMGCSEAESTFVLTAVVMWSASAMDAFTRTRG